MKQVTIKSKEDFERYEKSLPVIGINNEMFKYCGQTATVVSIGEMQGTPYYILDIDDQRFMWPPELCEEEKTLNT